MLHKKKKTRERKTDYHLMSNGQCKQNSYLIISGNIRGWENEDGEKGIQGKKSDLMMMFLSCFLKSEWEDMDPEGQVFQSRRPLEEGCV